MLKWHSYERALGLIQEKAFEAISQVVKCFMQCAALTSGDRYERIKGRSRNASSEEVVAYRSPRSHFRTPPRRPLMRLTVDTSRPADDDTKSIASTIDDESIIAEANTGGRLGWRSSYGVPSSPLRLPKSSKSAKSPIRSASTKHSD